MLRAATTYTVFAVFTFGFLTSFDRFMTEEARLGPLESAGRSVVWPFTLGQLAVGYLFGDTCASGARDSGESEREDPTDHKAPPQDDEGQAYEPPGPTRIATVRRVDPGHRAVGPGRSKNWAPRRHA